MVSKILTELDKRSVDYSVPQNDIEEWLKLADTTPYPAIAEALVKLIGMKRLRGPVFLDVIVFNYEQTPGAESPRILSDVNLSILKAAVLEGYRERHGGNITDFSKLLI